MSFPFRRVDFAILRYTGDGARPGRYLKESVLGYEVTCSYSERRTHAWHTAQIYFSTAAIKYPRSHGSPSGERT